MLPDCGRIDTRDMRHGGLLNKRHWAGVEGGAGGREGGRRAGKAAAKDRDVGKAAAKDRDVGTGAHGWGRQGGAGGRAGGGCVTVLLTKLGPRCVSKLTVSLARGSGGGS